MYESLLETPLQARLAGILYSEAADFPLRKEQMKVAWEGISGSDHAADCQSETENFPYVPFFFFSLILAAVTFTSSS